MGKRHWGVLMPCDLCILPNKDEAREHGVSFGCRLTGVNSSSVCRYWRDVHPVSVCAEYEVIFYFFPSRVSTVWCRLLSATSSIPLFSWAPWQRPSLYFPLCSPLTLAAVSLPRRDKTRLNHTHTCAFVVHRSTKSAHFHPHVHKSKDRRGIVYSLALYPSRVLFDNWSFWMFLNRPRRNIGRIIIPLVLIDRYVIPS